MILTEQELSKGLTQAVTIAIENTVKHLNDQIKSLVLSGLDTNDIIVIMNKTLGI